MTVLPMIEGNMTRLYSDICIDLTDQLVGFWVMRPLKPALDGQSFTVMGCTRDMVLYNFGLTGYDPKLYTPPYRKVMTGEEFCREFQLVADPSRDREEDRLHLDGADIGDPINLADVYPIS